MPVASSQSPAVAGSAVALLVAAVLLVLVVVGTVVSARVLRRRGYSGMGGDTIVRCRQGHLFTTIWVPGASLKAVRLGMSRYQRCPVGKHWTLVRPVKDQDLTAEDRAVAAEVHDAHIF